MLILYHGGTSTASAKVRLALAEKGMAFESRLLDLRRGDQKRADYLAFNPAGVVPTLVHDGAVVTESSVILEYVEEAWPEPALSPADPRERAGMRLWLRRVDDLHEACSILSSSVKLSAMRGDAAGVAALLARTHDPSKRERQRRLVEQGFEAPDVEQAARRYAAFLAQAESALADRPFLSGDFFGLADCAALPYAHRLDNLGMSALWAFRPAVADWCARARSRASFDEAVTRWAGDQAYSPCAQLTALAERIAGQRA